MMAACQRQSVIKERQQSSLSNQSLNGQYGRILVENVEK